MASESRMKRARYCVAPGCRNFESDTQRASDTAIKNNTHHMQKLITYHNFPTKSSLRNKWFKFIGHNNSKGIRGQTWRTWTICSEHFEDSEYEKDCNLECTDGEYTRLTVKLKNGAIPSKFKVPPTPPTTTRQDYEYENEYGSDYDNNIEIIKINHSVPTSKTMKDNLSIKNEYNEIELDNETFSTEQIENFQSKCGEIFITRKGIFLYFCTICNENLQEPEHFTQHIFKEHLSLHNNLLCINNNNNCSNNNNIKSEDIIKLSDSLSSIVKDNLKVPVPLQYCQIVENETGNFETVSFFDIDVNQDNNNPIENRNYINSTNEYYDMQNKLITSKNYDSSEIYEPSKLINNFNIKNIIDLTSDDDSAYTYINDADDKISIKNEALNELNQKILTTVNNVMDECPNVEKKSNKNSFHSFNNTTNISDILPASYNDKEFVEADDEDINENDEDDDWRPTKRKKFKCRFCSKILKSRFSLTVHERGHTGERPYKCHICSQCFKSQSILYNHEKRHTGVKPFECKICGLKYSTQYSSAVHKKLHETQKIQYKCSYCPKTFLRLKKKVLHQRAHNFDNKQELDENNILKKQFKCDFCSKILSTQFSLFEHRKIHTGEKPFVCKYCPLAFRSKLLCIIHERRCHTGERPFSCVYCEKAFVTKSIRDNHERSHSNERPFKCDHCEKTYRHPSAKYIHMKTHLFKKESTDGKKKSSTHCTDKKYQCEFCQKLLSSQTVLNEHRRIHTGEKPYSCKECGLRFRAKPLLLYHLQTHTGEKRYECKVCLKKFRLPGQLAVHFRIHTGEKPFSCNFCDKTFRQKQTKQTHEKTHMSRRRKLRKSIETRLWKCNICDKILLNKYTLTNHALTHSGKRPFKCSYCPSAFKSLQQQTQHERIHSGLKPYECIECSKTFTTKSQLNVHVRRHATNKLKPKAFKCNDCVKEFKFKKNFIMHQLIHQAKS